MSQPTHPVAIRAIHWPVPPNRFPLWRLEGMPGTSRIVPRPGRQRPLELVADPFSS